MTTRITDQFIEALYQGEGVIRATRTYVEVLRSVSEAPGAEHEESVSQSLGLTQQASGNFVRYLSASSTLLLTDDPQQPLSVHQELAFSEIVDFYSFVGDIHAISHSLGLIQSVAVDNASVEESGSTLALTQSVTVLGPIYVAVLDRINFSDGVVGSLGVPWLPIAVVDTLGLTDQAGRGIPQTVSHAMTLVDETYRVFTVADTLTLTHEVSAGQGDETEQSLNLSQTVQLNAIYRRSVSHTNFITDAFTYFIDSSCGRKQYAPFEGGEASMPNPRLSFKSQFTLENLTGPYLSVVLRNPELDNRDRLGFNRINRETSGGELDVFMDPVWAKINTLLFTFTAIKSEKIASVQSFMLATLGQEVKITDWTGTQWHGVITTPNEVATEDSDGYWTLSFEFEGEPYDGAAPDDRLSFTQNVEVSLESPP